MVKHYADASLGENVMSISWSYIEASLLQLHLNEEISTGSRNRRRHSMTHPGLALVRVERTNFPPWWHECSRVQRFHGRLRIIIVFALLRHLGCSLQKSLRRSFRNGQGIVLLRHSGHTSAHLQINYELFLLYSVPAIVQCWGTGDSGAWG